MPVEVGELDVVVVAVLVVLVVLLVVVEVELDELEALDDPSEPCVTLVPEPDAPTWIVGIPVGRVPIVTGPMPLPGLMMVVVPPPEPPLEPEPLEPEPLDPLEPELPLEPLEPELPLEPEEPEPMLTVVVGTLATGVGVVTVGVVTVVVPPPEPLLPVPEPVLPEPVLVGEVVCVGREPATGCEIVAEVEWRPTVRGAVDVPWPTCAKRVLRLLANAAGMPAACAPCDVTTLTDASPREEEEEECDPALG
jgi:hypothetical protein